MKSSISLSALARSIPHFLHRFHVMIFVLFVVGGLSVVTLLLNFVVTNRTASTGTDSSQSNFDTTTIEKVRSLQDANGGTSTLPNSEGRTNPFE